MSEKEPTNDIPKGELILYQTEDGRTRIECRFESETVWLTQALMAELFQTTPQNITQHLREIYAEGELDEEATCKSFLQVRTEPPTLTAEEYKAAVRVGRIGNALHGAETAPPLRIPSAFADEKAELERLSARIHGLGLRTPYTRDNLMSLAPRQVRDQIEH